MEAATLAQKASTEADVQPAITWLNMSGDVTITWDDANRDAIRQLVEEKMRAGYSFFILTPRILPQVFGNKKTRLTDPKQLDKAVGVVVADNQVASIVANLGDRDVEAVVNGGKAHLAAVPRTTSHDTVRRASSADEVVRNQTVAIRAIVGG